MCALQIDGEIRGFGLITKGKEGLNKYYIFGAHSRAQTFAAYMRDLYPERVCAAFLIDNDEKNPARIDGVPVIDLNRECSLDIDVPVYLAVRGNYHQDIIKSLTTMGMKTIIPVTPELDSELRNRFVPKAFAKMKREYHRIDEERYTHGSYECAQKQVGVYVAKTSFDAPIQKDEPLKDYERLIQVGRAVSDKSISECIFFDNEGENISCLNRHFSELTGMYWLWKNGKEDVVGLEHYRRRFILPKGWQWLFDDGQVDVILPVPLYVASSLEGNYLFRHDPHPWNAMIDCLKNDVGMYEQAKKFFGENGCFSPCNMLIAKREVVDDLCSWMFPILLKVVDEVGELPDEYQNRYAGFLSERLISFFFYYYADKYKVVYVDKSFLG